MGKKIVDENDVMEMYDVIAEQAREDRESILDVFKELRDYVRDAPSRYVELGDVIAKMSDLRMKQTGQLIEVFKTLEKMLPKDDGGSLTDDDFEAIHEAIEAKK